MIRASLLCLAAVLPVWPQAAFDFDLRAGKPPGAEVRGGRWDKGWLVVADGDQLVLDAGRELAEGSLEVWFTADRSPIRPKPKPGEEAEKVNWLGLYQYSHLDQNFGRPDLKARGAAFYLRTGNTYGTFSKSKVFAEAKEPCQNKIGAEQDWIADGHTVMKVRLAWSGGIAKIEDTRGRTYECTANEAGQRQTTRNLRYAVLGCDNLVRLSPVGVRFVRVRLAGK
jgi:hypothetical protein